MKRTLLLALFASAVAVGCGGGGDDNPTPTPSPTTTPAPTTTPVPTPTTAPRPTVQALYNYAGTWVDHDERCEWSSSANLYDQDVDVITRLSDGQFKREELTRYFSNAQCSGTAVRSTTKSVEYLNVVGQGQLADGTRVDQIHETAQPGAAVREYCIAFIQNDRLYEECNDAPRPFPTTINRNEWDLRQP